ncbi:MAG: sigma-70 family RNA polymerase sigma factor [Bryobacterales bacterium]|nr:sigma-70 family RNA polymerase sigma factor [Bryobacterales bacterium]
MLSIPEEVESGLTPDGKPDGQELEGAQAEWVSLVESIRSGDQEAMSQLYATFGRGVRYYLSRQLGAQEIDDKVHDTFLVVLGAIQRGELREPERLMGYVRTVVRRLVATHIDRLVEERRERTDVEDGFVLADDRVDPERDTLRRQRVEIMEQVLHTISRRDREILTRFYLYEQSQEQICQEMGLNDTQFRLLKSRAKQRFAELGKRRIEKANTTENNLLRKSAGSGH